MILGIDPGRSKIGWAFTDKSGHLLCSGIWMSKIFAFAGLISQKQWSHLQGSLLEGSMGKVYDRDLSCIVIGRGTSSNCLLDLLDPETVSSVQFVDESFTTLEARSLYWEIHEPGPLRRIFPFLCQFVPRDIDDLAALAIILRYLKQR